MLTLVSVLQRLILVLCSLLVVAIIGALSVQIVSRYVFNAPVHMTDDIAEISLIWLTFLGAAMVYREKGHIGVEIISGLESVAVRRTVHVGQHILVIAVMSYILTQVGKLEPLMSRLEFGTVPGGPFTSKFALILLPFAIGAALTILFAIEGIWRELTGRVLEHKGAQE